jgi:hypothetical protein
LIDIVERISKSLSTQCSKVTVITAGVTAACGLREVQSVFKVITTNTVLVDNGWVNSDWNVFVDEEVQGIDVRSDGDSLLELFIGWQVLSVTSEVISAEVFIRGVVENEEIRAVEFLAWGDVGCVDIPLEVVEVNLDVLESGSSLDIVVELAVACVIITKFSEGIAWAAEVSRFASSATSWASLAVSVVISVCTRWAFIDASVSSRAFQVVESGGALEAFSWVGAHITVVEAWRAGLFFLVVEFTFIALGSASWGSVGELNEEVTSIARNTVAWVSEAVTADRVALLCAFSVLVALGASSFARLAGLKNIVEEGITCWALSWASAGSSVTKSFLDFRVGESWFNRWDQVWWVQAEFASVGAIAVLASWAASLARSTGAVFTKETEVSSWAHSSTLTAWSQVERVSAFWALSVGWASSTVGNSALSAGVAISSFSVSFWAVSHTDSWLSSVLEEVVVVWALVAWTVVVAVQTVSWAFAWSTNGLESTDIVFIEVVAVSTCETVSSVSWACSAWFITINAGTCGIDKLSSNITCIYTATIGILSKSWCALVASIEAITAVAVVSALVAPSVSTEVAIGALFFARSVVPVILPVAVTVLFSFTSWIFIETAALPSWIAFQTPSVLEGWIEICGAGFSTSERTIIVFVAPVSSLAFCAITSIVGSLAAFVNLCLVISTTYTRVTAPTIVVF